MGFEKGHQKSRKIFDKVWTDEEVIALGEELLIWMQKNDKNKDIVHASNFYGAEKGIPKSEWKKILQRAYFLPYYEQLLEWLGRKLINNRNISTRIADRFIDMYLTDLLDHEKEKLKTQLELERQYKIDDKIHATPEEIDHNKKIIDALLALQAQKDASY
ncbi:MAG: hypothetical protein KGI50_05410 [Patescibacteria group bacterium]|nr:hypothetical protein [Patescibacteria group bacterium]MDE2438757.1 hypothetical protein [Patescibacteria group bacterium]